MRADPTGVEVAEDGSLGPKPAPDAGFLLSSRLEGGASH